VNGLELNLGFMTGTEVALAFMTFGMIGSVIWIRERTKSSIVTALVVAAWIAAAYFAGLIT
jgi:hypothetical protein